MQYPFLKYISHWTDVYFKKTQIMVQKEGDVQVCYGVFLRSKCMVNYDHVIHFFKKVSSESKKKYGQAFQGVTLYMPHKNGDVVSEKTPLFFYSGSFVHLAELEPFILQLCGLDWVVSYKAYKMVCVLPHIGFIAMDFRHCIDHFMAHRVANAVAYGSSIAKQRHPNAIGFIGNATDATVGAFGLSQGMGTMPHAFVGYATSTLQAAQIYHDTFPDQDLVVLMDYFGREISDSIAVCKQYKDLVHAGRLRLRFDTSKVRYIEGLDWDKSYALLKDRIPDDILNNKRYQSHLCGPGTSVAAAYHVKNVLKFAGFDQVKIVFSSSFDLSKVKAFALSQAPVDIIGTGSYLAFPMEKAFSTADIIRYGDVFRVKEGREFLIKYYKKHQASMKTMTF